MLKFFIITGVFIVLTSCQGLDVGNGTNEIANRVLPKGIEYINNELNYKMSFPELITESSSWFNSITEEGGPFFGTAVDYSIDPPFGRRNISIEVHNSSPSCSSEIMGYPEVTADFTIDDALTIWGRIPDEGKNAYWGINPGVTLCYYPQNCSQEEYFQSGCQNDMAIYAFCSEKDDKRVVICISQQTDDPKMAEEIFKTFKWIK